MQRVVHALNDHFLNLLVFNANNFFIIQAMIVIESQTPNCDSKAYCLGFNTVKTTNDLCKGELLELTETLRHECEN